MIVSFYNHAFKGLQNNASLVVDNASYSLVLRGVELDSISCTCEAFTESIQPTFLVVKNERGNYVYGCLAGIPQLDDSGKTKITGSDLKTMFKSDVVLDLSKPYANVNAFLEDVFGEWDRQVNQGSFRCMLEFGGQVGTIPFDYLTPIGGDKSTVKDAWNDVFAPYLKYYGLFMTSRIDLVGKKVIFHIGRSLFRSINVKLWELGINNYGKWVADVNETQGYVLKKSTRELLPKEGIITVPGGVHAFGEIKWILTDDNQVTNVPFFRKIYPVKRKLVVKEAGEDDDVEALKNEASQEALKTLTNSMFKEDIEISDAGFISQMNAVMARADRQAERIERGFEAKFNVYARRGEGLYKTLPCGELHYDANGLKKVQIGYRFTGIQFLF